MRVLWHLKCLSDAPGHFQHSRICIRKEILVACAVSVKPGVLPSRQSSRSRLQPLRQSGIPAAVPAFVRHMAGEADKVQFLPLFIHLFKGCGADIPPASIHPAHKNRRDKRCRPPPPPTVRNRFPSYCRIPEDNYAASDPVFKGTVIDRMAFLPVPIPVIKRSFRNFP